MQQPIMLIITYLHQWEPTKGDKKSFRILAPACASDLWGTIYGASTSQCSGATTVKPRRNDCQLYRVFDPYDETIALMNYSC